MQRIAAVVNDDVITVLDLEARLYMIVVTSQLPDSAELRQRLRPQILQSLIQEKLRLQEAKRLDVTISDAEILDGFSRLEKQNKTPPGSFVKFLQAKGIDLEIAKSQVRGDLAWFQVIARTIEPKVIVGSQEIELELNQLRNNLGRPQNLVAEIFLPVDSPARDGEMSALAQKLEQQIRGGASFQSLARQFSQSPTAALGGDLGWVFKGQLAAELENVLDSLSPSQMSSPVRSLTGYHILLLRDRRVSDQAKLGDIKLTLSQLYLPTDGAAVLTEDKRREIALRASEAKSCPVFDALATEYELSSSGPSGVLAATDLPENVRKVLLSLPENKASPAVPVTGADVIFMVCKREEPNLLPSSEAVAERLKRDRVDILARRKLRELQRAAIIDIRL